MKLKNKLLLSQIAVFIVIFMILTMAISNIVYLTVSKRDRENAMNLNEQIMTSMDQYFGELERFTAVVADDDDLGKLIETYIGQPNNANAAKIRLYLSSFKVKEKIQSYDIIGIFIDLNKSQKEYDFTTVGLSDCIKTFIRQNNNENTPLGDKGRFIDPFPYKGESTTVFGNNFNMVYGFTSRYSKAGTMGSVTVIASFDQIIYCAENASGYSKDYLLLNNKNGVIKPSVKNSRIDIGTALNNLTYGDSYYEGYYREPSAVTTVRLSKYGNWKLICRLTKDDILENNKSLIILDVLLVAIFGITVMAIMIPTVQKFMKPLADVSVQMEEIARGNLDARVMIQSNDEIGEVGRSFNIMAEKLQENISKMLEQEKREQKIRYSLLVSQVDPHFIYNTMNTITYLAQKNRNDDVIAVNKAMIEILKDRLRIEVDNVYDTIEQEIKVVKQYLIIQEYRYAGTFKTKIEVQEEACSYYIVKNILQPLVENAIFHGILCNKDEDGEVIGGRISIFIRLHDEYITIIVSDNGAGMSKEIKEGLDSNQLTTKRGEHIGIKNIIERIRYIYGENYKFSLESREGEGTTITIRLLAVAENEKFFREPNR